MSVTLNKTLLKAWAQLKKMTIENPSILMANIMNLRDPRTKPI